MNREVLLIAEQIKDAYEGNPWYGRNMKQLLSEIGETIAFEKPAGQHSILELLWHMIAWKEFIISRLRTDNDKPLHYFEERDWMQLDHSDKKLWKEGLKKFHELHTELVDIIWQQKDELLAQKVSERNYDFRKLLHGIVEHDIYHIGQVAYIVKMLKK